MIKLFRHLKPYAPSIAAILFLILVQSLADLALPTLMSDIVDKGIARGDIPLIWKTGGWMLILASAGILSNVAAGYLTARASMGFGRDLRSKVFTKVTSFSLDEIDRFGTASLITRTTNDITQVQQLTFMMLRMMVSAPMMAIGGIIMAVGKEPKLSWILIVAIPVITGVIILLARKGLPLFKAIQKKIDTLNRIMRENLTGIRVIRAFNRTEYEAGRFDASNRDLTETSLKVNRLMAFLFPFIMLIMNLTTIAIIWIGGIAIDRGDVQIGSLMAFIQYTMQIMFSIVMVSMMIIMIPRAAVSAGRIGEVLDVVPEITDPASPRTPERISGHVEFRNVTFSYHGAEQPAVRDISFHAKPGEITAIIGGTGSGKSTIVNLIPRFYDPDSGEILVDGVNIREMTQNELRSRIGLVPQTAVLFTGTIEENIAFGTESLSRDRMEEAARISQSIEFIEAREAGYDERISQGGTNLSGGQKQRLSIARALARRPEINIYTDSFSALAYRTDAKLRSALRSEIADGTVIIVAQRVSTVMNADRIIVLEDGKIVGVGKHKELMNSCEVYREIVSSQLSEEELV